MVDEVSSPPLEGVRVRAARGSDLPAVIALDAENTGVSKASYWRERFEWYAGRQPDRFFLVAERDDTMLAKDAHLLLSFFRSLGMMGGPFIQLEKRL